MPYEPPPDLAGLTLPEIARLADARKLPPLDEWSPQLTADSLIRIAADGTWYHDGGVIRRAAMVRAFASLLMRDADGQHWLVTPFEKQLVEVEDAALLAVDVQQDGGALAFRLNTDDIIIAGPDHPIVARGDAETPAIYLSVRHGTEARLNRSTYYQLVDFGMNNSLSSVSSQGKIFSLVPA